MPVPCPAYFTRYDTVYWGGTAFENLLLMLDADDGGLLKEGLFTHDMPLFDMKARHIEEWTVSNRSPSDHTFHIHQNPFLVTHINGTALSSPFIEWHDVITVPKIVGTTVGSVTFRTYLNPVTKGSFVMHCHMLQHEDVGMMQRLDIRR
jgi:FtsP/CotA-like multicopper oxidase with cupredoxin domain